MPRITLALACTVLLTISGCGSLPIFDTVQRNLQAAFELTSSVEISPDYVVQLPYASLLSSLDDANPVLLVLAKADNDERSWVSADKIVLTTRHGRIVRTIGLPHNLIHVNAASTDPLRTGLHRISDGERYERSLDLMPGYHFGVRAHSTFRRIGLETVEILGKSRQLLHVEEQVSLPELSKSFSNDFWVDAETGFVWKSRQYPIPFLPVIDIAITKPYIGDLQP